MQSAWVKTVFPIKKLSKLSVENLLLRRNVWKTSGNSNAVKNEPYFLNGIKNRISEHRRCVSFGNDSGSYDYDRKRNTGKYLSLGLFIAFGFFAAKKRYKFELVTLHALSIPIIHDIQDDSEESSKIPPSKSNNFIADVVDKVASAVVYIEVIGRHPFTGQQITLSNGSGFIIENDGLILTNAHVVGNERFVICKLHDGRVFKALVEDRDPQMDLATLRIPASDLPTIKLGESSKVRPGEFVVAMGSPLSLSNTITAGIISSVHRASKELGLPNSEMEYIQTDASITFGNSGGPLVNLDGEAIAINTMKVTAGISFAIPADYAKEFLANSKVKKDKGWFKSKTVEQPGRRYLGITMLTLTPSIIAELQQRRVNFPNVNHGVLVWKIVLDSPAHQAGLQPGDVITHINRKEVVSSQDVYKAINDAKPLRLTIRRDHNTLELTVTPEEIA